MTDIDVDKIPLSFHHPSDGKALRYHVDDFMSQWIPRLVDDLWSNELIRVAETYVNGKLLRLYLGQALHLELIGVGQALFRRRYLLETEGEKLRDDIDCPPVLYDLVRRNWEDKEIGIIRGKSNKIRRFFRTAKRQIERALFLIQAVGKERAQFGSLSHNN